MEFNFKIDGDSLIATDCLDGNTGNLNTYICKFDILTNADFLWICVFRGGGKVCQVVMENGSCTLPDEVLQSSGIVEIGCYGAKDGKQVSTNWLEFTVNDGAFSNTASPFGPTPDMWETLVMKSVPYIGENGNWYVYDKERKEYKDSGCAAGGKDGYSPKKGVDYWTDEDKAEIADEVEKNLNLDDRIAQGVGSRINSLQKTVTGNSLVIDDISPVEHIMDIKLYHKNMAYSPVYNDASVVSGERTAICAYCYPFKKGKYYTISFDTENTGAELLVSLACGNAVTNDYVVADGTRKKASFEVIHDYYSSEPMPLVVVTSSSEASSGICGKVMVEEGGYSGEYIKGVEPWAYYLCVYDQNDNLINDYIIGVEETIENVISQYPVTKISTVSGITIECTYNRDATKAYNELVNAIISLGGNVNV